MARAIWTGAISFGLVTVPVKLYSATSSHRVDFHQFQEGTGERVRYKRVAEGTGEEVDYEDIVKGHEVEKGRYVIVTPEELDAVEPTRSRTIDIEESVSLGDIDPISWNKTYYLGPAEDVGAEKPYVLLHRAMQETNKVAIGRFVMRNKQYLATIRPIGDVLGLETMYFADEVRSTKEVDNLPGDVGLADRELASAEQLIDSLAGPWEPEKYRDTYRERVLELIERRAKGEEIVVEREEETPEVADLMEALRASVEAAQQRRAGGAASMAAAREDDYTSLSKDDLYERAAEAGIPGRSRMKKEELIGGPAAGGLVTAARPSSAGASSAGERCRDCRAQLAHCHGLLVHHTDGTLECLTGPHCSAEIDLHDIVEGCAELRPSCLCGELPGR